MSKARLASLAAFAAAAALGLAAFLLLKPFALAAGGFLFAAVVGMVLAGRVFDQLASPAERRADLAERARDPL